MKRGDIMEKSGKHNNDRGGTTPKMGEWLAENVITNRSRPHEGACDGLIAPGLWSG